MILMQFKLYGKMLIEGVPVSSLAFFGAAGAWGQVKKLLITPKHMREACRMQPRMCRR